MPQGGASPRDRTRRGDPARETGFSLLPWDCHLVRKPAENPQAQVPAPLCAGSPFSECRLPAMRPHPEPSLRRCSDLDLKEAAPLPPRIAAVTRCAAAKERLLSDPNLN